MDVSYATMIAIGTLVQRLGRDARRLEKALAETMNASAEWRRIVDELKAERDAERKAHDEYKERNRDIFNGNQRLTAELAVIKDERDALRAECDDLENAIDALKKERDDLWQREGIEQKRRIDVEAERDELRAQLDTERERHKQKTVDVPRAHPVKVGEYVKNDNGDVCQVHEVYAEYLLNTGWTWAFENCTPCDPPASHDTPAGKLTAQAAVTPQPGDMVRLVREPTHTDIPAMLPWSKAFGMPGDTATVVIMAIPDKLPNGTIPVRTSMGRAFFWPLSCVEVVKGGDK